MATAQERQDDFIERLDEMGLKDIVSIKNQVSIPERVNIEVGEFKLLPYQLTQAAVMGLMAHFINRKWAKDWSYTYICKDMHSITFTSESD